MSDRQQDRTYRSTLFTVAAAAAYAGLCFGTAHFFVGSGFERPLIALMIAVALYFGFLKVERRMNPYV